MQDKKVNAIFAVILALNLIVSGVTYASLNTLTGNQAIIAENQASLAVYIDTVSEDIKIINMAQSIITDNQASIVENQAALANHIDSLTDYVAILGNNYQTETGVKGAFDINVHVQAIHRDSDGNILGFSSNAGVLTTIGKNWIEDQLGDSPNATSTAQYIALSNDAGAPSAAWLVIPNEIAANNLTRAQGAYTSTGDGVWTCIYTFTASGVQAVQLVGVNWDASGSNNCLLFADQITSASMEANDTLEITATITIS